jgi:hypothetical protein
MGWEARRRVDRTGDLAKQGQEIRIWSGGRRGGSVRGGGILSRLSWVRNRHLYILARVHGVQMDSVKRHLEKKIEGTEAKMSAIDRRFSTMEGKMSAMEEKMEGKLDFILELLQGLRPNNQT